MSVCELPSKLHAHRQERVRDGAARYRVNGRQESDTLIQRSEGSEKGGEEGARIIGNDKEITRDDERSHQDRNY